MATPDPFIDVTPRRDPPPAKAPDPPPEQPVPRPLRVPDRPARPIRQPGEGDEKQA